MNITIPTNLCTDRATAQAGQIVSIKSYGGNPQLRLVIRVTPTRICLQNGGGVGTERWFQKDNGREIGRDRYDPHTLYALTPDSYTAAVKYAIKGSLVNSIHGFQAERRTFEQVEQAAIALEIHPDAFKLPHIY